MTRHIVLLAYDGSATAKRALQHAGGIKPQIIEAVGDPANEILAAAEGTRAETIVLGRSETRHRVHGSLASRLERSAQSDVLIVH